MNLQLEPYQIDDFDRIMTPALLIYPELVDVNIKATLKMLGGDPNRWRPHIKTAKLSAIVRQLMEHGIVNFKCSTTLELLTACQAGAADVLLAYSRNFQDRNYVVVSLIEVQRRTPAAEKLPLVAVTDRRQIEEAVHFIPKRCPAVESRPNGDFG